jgi:hypothetical protein
MTEGNGTKADVDYLAHNPRLGVSANFVSLADGTIYQMLDIHHASGSLHPGDISTKNKPFYGGEFLKEALPDPLWRDPNTWVISIEIGGKAAVGPTDIQTAAIIAWAKDMKSRFPTITGIFGHADQTDEKPCPGTSANMLSIFAALGHGVYDDMVPAPITSIVPILVSAPKNAPVYGSDGTTVVGHLPNARVDAYSPYAVGTKRSVYIGPVGGFELGLIVPTSFKPIPVPVPTDCTAAIATAIAADRAKAKIVYE